MRQYAYCDWMEHSDGRLNAYSDWMKYFDGRQNSCAIGLSTLTADKMFATIFLSIFYIGATDSEGGWQGLSPFGSCDTISRTIFLEKVCRVAKYVLSLQ